MSIEINSGFKSNAPVSIDERMVLSKSEMLNIDDNIMPDIYFCICSDDKCVYVYDKNRDVNDISTTTGKFKIANYEQSMINTSDPYTKKVEMYNFNNGYVTSGGDSYHLLYSFNTKDDVKNIKPIIIDGIFGYGSYGARAQEYLSIGKIAISLKDYFGFYTPIIQAVFDKSSLFLNTTANIIDILVTREIDEENDIDKTYLYLYLEPSVGFVNFNINYPSDLEQIPDVIESSDSIRGDISISLNDIIINDENHDYQSNTVFVLDSFINNNTTSFNSTWSSGKINSELEKILSIVNSGNLINDTELSDTNTWSSNKIANETKKKVETLNYTIPESTNSFYITKEDIVNFVNDNFNFSDDNAKQYSYVPVYLTLTTDTDNVLVLCYGTINGDLILDKTIINSNNVEVTLTTDDSSVTITVGDGQPTNLFITT